MAVYVGPNHMRATRAGIMAWRADDGDWYVSSESHLSFTDQAMMNYMVEAEVNSRANKGDIEVVVVLDHSGTSDIAFVTPERAFAAAERLLSEAYEVILGAAKDVPDPYYNARSIEVMAQLHTLRSILNSPVHSPGYVCLGCKRTDRALWLVGMGAGGKPVYMCALCRNPFSRSPDPN